MGLLSLGSKLSKVSKKLNAMDLSDIDVPAADKTPEVLEEVPLNLKLNNVDNDLSDEALEMLGDKKAIKDWKDSNKVPVEESKRRKQRKFAKQATDLKEGIMSGPAYRAYIKENQPATSFTSDDLKTMLPNFKQIVGALTTDKSDKGILGLNSKLEKGNIVSSRLDIPAYNEHNIWVTSIVDKVKGKLYGRTAVLKDVNFDMTNEGAKQLALDIATEKKKTVKRLNKETGERVAKEETQTKTPFATMKGAWQNVSDKDAFSLAKEYINDPDWVQVGFNPERHSFFYDKATMLPVFEAEEVVQVGALVLAKVKKLNTPELRAARIAKLRKLRITNMPEGAKPTTFNKGGAILMNNQMQQFAEGGLKDEGGMIDEVSGNEVPIGGTKEGVRDDIPANVSEGEFIFPADVVRFIGLDKLMKIRQNAKMGLKKMEAMGQMGNSDEATIDDDMPFEMSDLIVVGGKGEPMELAGGGFIPVEDYTVVQDMIEDRSDKAAAIDKDQAMSDMIADNTTKSAVVDKTQEEEVQNFFHGGVAHSNTTLDTAYVPTFSPDEIPDYNAYMNSVTIEVKVYINAAGEKINITFINGVPTTPIEDGYTLYVAPEEGAEVSPEEVIAQTINNNNDNRDNEPYVESSIKPINYEAMSPEDFATRMEYESTKGYKLQKAFALGVSSLVPFGAGLAYGTMRGHARQSEIRLNEMITNAPTAELKTKYTKIRDDFLKANSLLPSSESGVIAKWVDGILVGSGINPEASADAANAVNGITQVGSLATQQSNALANVLADPASEIYTGSTNVTARPASYDPAQFGSGDPTLNTSAIATSPEIVPSGSDQNLGKFSGSPSASTDFKNLSTKDQMNVLTNKRAIDRYGSVNDKSITKDLNPDEMQALQNLQMTQGTRASFDDTYRAADQISGASGGTKVAGSPAPVPAQTGDPSVSIGTSNVGQRPTTYDPSQFGSGEPVAATSSSTEQVPIMSEKSLPNFIRRTGKGILNFITSGTGNTAEETPSVTSTEPYTPQQFTNQFAVPDQQLPESVPQQQQSAFTGPTFDTAQQTTEAFDQGVSRSPVVSTDVVATDPRGTSAGDLGYSSLNQANTTTDTSTQFAKPDVNLTAPMVDPRTNVLTTPAVYPEGMDPSKIKYTPPKVLETPIIATPKVPNTTYQDVANRLTPGDGKKYVNGVLLDDSGNPVNSLYQQTANLFTPFDGKEYKNGVLIDSETRKPITETAQAATVVQPERTEVWKDKLTGSALRAAQDAEKAGYTGSTVNDFAIGVISDGKTKGVLADAEGKVVRDANNRTVYVDAEGNQYVKTDILGMSTETPTGTVATQKEDSGESKQADSAVKVSVRPTTREDKSGEREANRAANKAAAKAEKTQQNAGRTESFEQKIKRGGGFNKGGLASKPKAKTKTTNKRGLAARK